MQIFYALMKQQMRGEVKHFRSLEDHINDIFGDIYDMDMDIIMIPEVLLNILRINYSELYNQLFCSSIMIIKTIIQQFIENDKFPIEPIKIGQPFFITFQNFYPKKFTIEKFKLNIQTIPYYKESVAVRQNTNAFLLTAARIFCTTDHYLLIESILLAM
jgi:hypothetical protein